MNIQDKYVNPFTDFGFKKLFGSEPNKEFLIGNIATLSLDTTSISEHQSAIITATLYSTSNLNTDIHLCMSGTAVINQVYMFNLDLDNKIKRFENLSKFSLSHTPLATLLENSRKKQEVGKKILELFNKQTEVIKSTCKYQELKRELVKLN